MFHILFKWKFWVECKLKKFESRRGTREVRVRVRVLLVSLALEKKIFFSVEIEELRIEISLIELSYRSVWACESLLQGRLIKNVLCLQNLNSLLTAKSFFDPFLSFVHLLSTSIKIILFRANLELKEICRTLVSWKVKKVASHQRVCFIGHSGFKKKKI